MSIAKNITEAREERGISKSGFARLLDVTPSAVGAWETGRAEPRGAKLKQIARLLGKEVSDLVDGSNTHDDAEDAESMSELTTAEEVVADARSRIAAIYQTNEANIEIKIVLN